MIVAEDASRLGRNMAEQAAHLAELRDIGVHIVTQDLDTRQESSEWMGAILGTAASAYRSEIARRTRRGLEGRAPRAMPTGGKAYGCEVHDGRRVIIQDQATIVIEIFERLLLADIQSGLLDPEVMREIERRVRQAARGQRRNDSESKIAQLEKEVSPIVTAISQGMLSPALRQRLQDAEVETDRLRSAPKLASIEDLLPTLPGLIRGHVRNLAQLAQREPVRARMEVRKALDTDLLTIRPAETGRGVIVEFGLAPVQLLTGTLSEIMVAGACYRSEQSR